MPANTTHPDYDARKGQWARCRAAVAGQDAVHDGKQAYLPRLSEQTDAEYDAYRTRTPWYGATGRTLDGLVGMIFRSAPRFEAPAALKVFAEDITLGGVTLDGIARDVTEEVLQMGRIGLLVEYPQVAEQPNNLAAASAMNLRPYVTVYKTEHIVNWKLARVNNAMQPVLIVLQESYDVDGDEFESKTATQYRALILGAAGYLQRVYREQGEKKEWVQFGGDVVPLKGGAPLTAIPFYPFGPRALSMEMQQSPLLDLVDLNLSHYRTAADLEHGAHFTGLPTPFIAGMTQEVDASGIAQPIRIGSSTAIVSGDPAASATYMEFTGQGLGALERLMDRKEKQMAALGARMLAPEKAGVEAADTLSMRHNGEDSVLAGIAVLVAYGITEMLTFMGEWAGIAGELKYTLNTDYLPKGMSAQDIAALVAAWQQGAISYQTLFAKLQQGEVIAADVTEEEEQARSVTQAPQLTTPPAEE